MFFRCLLLVLVCLQDFTVAENPNGPDQCCFSYQRHRIPVRVITEYKETDRRCANPGVIFTLKSGREVCADPSVQWVQNIIKTTTQPPSASPTQPQPNENGPQCCSSFQTHPIPVSVIETYEETHMDCTKAGVIFTLNYGHLVCTDHGTEWVQQAMKRIDQKLFASSIISDENGPQCCISFRTHPIPVSVIETYKETHMDCTIARVIFTLKYGHRVCKDHGTEWVQQAMKRIDQKLFASSVVRDRYVWGRGPCCSSYRTRRIPVRLITDYKVTERQCTNPGVIFTLKSGREVCADPNVQWVKNIMKIRDLRLYTSLIQPDPSV